MSKAGSRATLSYQNNLWSKQGGFLLLIEIVVDVEQNSVEARGDLKTFANCHHKMCELIMNGRLAIRTNESVKQINFGDTCAAATIDQ